MNGKRLYKSENKMLAGVCGEKVLHFILMYAILHGSQK